eukprot:2057058-Rhodomonas_salina.2
MGWAGVCVERFWVESRRGHGQAYGAMPSHVGSHDWGFEASSRTRSHEWQFEASLGTCGGALS